MLFAVDQINDECYSGYDFEILLEKIAANAYYTVEEVVENYTFYEGKKPIKVKYTQSLTKVTK